jgi:hypothetical protein
MQYTPSEYVCMCTFMYTEVVIPVPLHHAMKMCVEHQHKRDLNGQLHTLTTLHIHFIGG